MSKSSSLRIEINNFPVVTLWRIQCSDGGKGGARVVFCVRDNISKELTQVHTLKHLCAQLLGGLTLGAVRGPDARFAFSSFPCFSTFLFLSLCSLAHVIILWP
jgi:hypothetical protein